MCSKSLVEKPWIRLALSGCSSLNLSIDSILFGDKYVAF